MDDLELNPLYEKVIDGLMQQHYCVVDDFFTPDEVATLRSGLLEKYEESVFKKSAIGNNTAEQVVNAVRGDFILWLDEAAQGTERVFFDKVANFVQYLNRTCYMGIRKQEFHYAVYPPGTFYKRHLDTFQNDSSRKLSIVCYLNTEDWQPEYGGELAIYLPKTGGVEDTVTVYPLQGRVVVFESQLLEHEVKPVQRERLSITGWLKTGG
ncbi:2OG-Fe(II) oxygenase [Flavobacterium psychrotrophum]|uniref:2OG-Fe(II) oxygenase n=1 Tax=Flavobacterium psychrotrophum TaxID=2294119 RepID=UPI000E31DED4|nr:2OG-Fe(II) oxygenase [Flavobacterium psychrotrophum]